MGKIYGVLTRVAIVALCVSVFLGGCMKKPAQTSRAKAAGPEQAVSTSQESNAQVTVKPTPLVTPSEVPKEGDYVKEDKEKGIQFYFKDGLPVRLERDKNGDGKPDIWIFYENGKPARSEVDRNGDGKPDYFRYMDKEGLTEKEAGDQNYDGTLDVWVTYDKGVKAKMEVDKNFDGKIDGIFEYDRMGNLVSAQMDTDFNGSFDKVVSPQNAAGAQGENTSQKASQ